MPKVRTVAGIVWQGRQKTNTRTSADTDIEVLQEASFAKAIRILNTMREGAVQSYIVGILRGIPARELSARSRHRVWLPKSPQNHRGNRFKSLCRAFRQRLQQCAQCL